MNDFEALRQLYDLTIVYEQMTGQPWPGHEVVCPMPHHQHANYTPSFHIYVRTDGTQYFKCHGNCGAYGDVIDFVGYMNYGAAYNHVTMAHQAAFDLAQRQLSLHQPTRPTRPATFDRQKTMADIRAWQEALHNCPQAIQYLASRGIAAVMDRFKLGYLYRESRGLPEHYITIPAFQDHILRGVKLRRIDSFYTDRMPLRYTSIAGSRLSTFNLDPYAYLPVNIFMPEGEMDVMLLEAMGFPAFCLTAGALSLTDDIILPLTQARVIIIREPDKAGEDGAGKRHALLNSVVVDTGFADVGDMYQQKGAAYVRQWAQGVIDGLGNLRGT